MNRGTKKLGQNSDSYTENNTIPLFNFEKPSVENPANPALPPRGVIGDHAFCQQQLADVQAASRQSTDELDLAYDLLLKAVETSVKENKTNILEHDKIVQELADKESKMHMEQDAHNLATKFYITSLSEYARSLEMVVYNLIQETNRDYVIACKIFQAYNVSHEVLQTFFQDMKDITGKPINWNALDVTFSSEDLDVLYTYLLKKAKSPRFSRFEKFSDPNLLILPNVVVTPAPVALTATEIQLQLATDARKKGRQTAAGVQTVTFGAAEPIAVAPSSSPDAVIKMPSFIDDFLKYFLDDNPDNYELYDKSMELVRRPQSVFSQAIIYDSVFEYYGKYPRLCPDVSRLNAQINQINDRTTKMLANIRNIDSNTLRPFTDLTIPAVNPPSKNQFISFADAFSWFDNSSGAVFDIYNFSNPTPLKIIEKIQGYVKSNFVVLTGVNGINKKILDDTSLGFASSVPIIELSKTNPDATFSSVDITKFRDTVIKVQMAEIDLLTETCTTQDATRTSAASTKSSTLAASVTRMGLLNQAMADLREEENTRLVAEKNEIDKGDVSGSGAAKKSEPLAEDFKKKELAIQKQIDELTELDLGVTEADARAQTAYGTSKTALDNFVLEYTNNYFMYLWMVFHQTAFDKNTNPDNAKNIFHVSY